MREPVRYWHQLEGEFEEQRYIYRQARMLARRCKWFISYRAIKCHVWGPLFQRAELSLVYGQESSAFRPAFCFYPVHRKAVKGVHSDRITSSPEGPLGNAQYFAGWTGLLISKSWTVSSDTVTEHFLSTLLTGNALSHASPSLNRKTQISALLMFTFQWRQ